MRKLTAAMLMLAVALLLLTGSAGAASGPPMSKADREQISTVLDEFVKDAVLRENLRDAWALAGPGLRAGATRAAWVKGREVTVPYFPARGRDFRNAWTGALVSSSQAELSMIAHPKRGTKGFLETAFAIEMRKIGGRWRVNSFYSDAEFGKKGVIGSGDFQVFRFDRDYSSYYDVKSRRHWLYVIVAGIGAVALLIPLGIFLRIRRRDRRAWASYKQAH